MAKRRKLKKGPARGLAALILIAVILGGVYVYQTFFTEEGNILTRPTRPDPEPEPELGILDLDSTVRPFAVIINNLGVARPYHSGLQDAYLVYEMIVEGGVTRFLALFDGRTDTERIGSIRSARHYFIDYALENDAILVHHGQSPQAASDFSAFNVNRIVIGGSGNGWRDNNLRISSEHRLFTSMEMMQNSVGNIRTERNRDYLLNYSIELIDLSTKDDAQVADSVEIVYSTALVTSYEFDAEARVYRRYVNGRPHVDFVTGEQFTVKNIITYQVANTGIGAGRQTLSNIGSGTGYFITNGHAVPITWEKSSRSGQTIYRFKDGTPLTVNDGNTFIQIQPRGQRLSITEIENTIYE